MDTHLAIKFDSDFLFLFFFAVLIKSIQQHDAAMEATVGVIYRGDSF